MYLICIPTQSLHIGGLQARFELGAEGATLVAYFQIDGQSGPIETEGLIKVGDVISRMEGRLLAGLTQAEGSDIINVAVEEALQQRTSYQDTGIVCVRVAYRGATFASDLAVDPTAAQSSALVTPSTMGETQKEVQSFPSLKQREKSDANVYPNVKPGRLLAYLGRTCDEGHAGDPLGTCERHGHVDFGICDGLEEDRSPDTVASWRVVPRLKSPPSAESSSRYADNKQQFSGACEDLRDYLKGMIAVQLAELKV